MKHTLSRLVTRPTILLMLATMLAGCVARTVSIPEPSPLIVPDNISSEQAGLVLRRAILQTGTRDFRGHAWRIEQDQSGYLIISTRPRAHYLRLAVRYNESRVPIRIIDGENVLYSERWQRIHGNAIGWVNLLEEHLQRALYEESLNQGGGPPAPGAQG